MMNSEKNMPEKEPPRVSRKKEMVRLKESGLNNAEIGRIYGITRERVRKILKRDPVKQILNLKQRKPRRKKSLKTKIFLTTSDVAFLIGVHGNTVRRWCNNSLLICYRDSQLGYRKFRRQDIINFLKDRK